MRGEFIGVWAEMRREIWSELVAAEAAPANLYSELYSALAPALRVPLSVEALAEITADPTRSRDLFLATTADNIAGERALVKVLEAIYDALDDLVGDTLTNPYFNLLEAFVERYSLRYDLRRPCLLCPTLPGIFAALIREIRVAAGLDQHLTNLLHAFEESIRELRSGTTDVRIKTCIQRQMNLLEAFGSECKGVTGDTLGKICDQVGTWPHAEVKKAVKSLYSFASDYPGIRHGGSPGSAIRNIEMRDLVAVSIALVGLTSYLTDLLNAEHVYRGV